MKKRIINFKTFLGDPEQHRRWIRSPIFWLLIFTFLHGLWYAFIVHPWQAPDEYVHYEYLRGFISQRTLDPFSEGRDGTVQRELLPDLRTFQHFRYRLIPTPPESQLEANPTPLGAVHLYPHPPFYYLLSIPFYLIGSLGGTLTQLYMLRTFSILLMCMTVWLTYKLSSLVFHLEHRPFLAILPAALIALLPKYVYISASYNNDVLTVPLVAAALYFLVRGYQRKANHRDLLAGAAFTVLAISTKRTAFGILPVLAISILTYSLVWIKSSSRWLRLIGAAAWAFTPILLVIVITFLLNPPTIPAGLSRLLRMSPNSLERFSTTLSLDALKGVDWSTFGSYLTESFWGWFGWLTLKIPAPLQEGFQILTILLVLGSLGAVARRLSGRKPDTKVLKPFAAMLFVVGLISTLILMTAQHMIAPASYPPQGRYLFPFLPALVILGVWSWLSYWPRRLQHTSLLIAWALLALYDVYAWAYIILPGWYS